MTWDARLRAYWTEPAYGLAALRIAVVGILLLTPELRAAPELARRPELLFATPTGAFGSLWALVDPAWAGALRVATLSAGATALLGYWSRLSCGVLAVAATLLLSLCQRVGAPLHCMHLLWLLALLAVSRSGDVWSLDAWGDGPPLPSPHYGAALCMARALLGFVYLFPGVHKLKSAGLAWGSAENLTAIMHDKWFQYGRVPWLRLDEWPHFLGFSGVFVLLFELSFLGLALVRQTRLLALFGGLLFHATTQAAFFIAFPSIWVCYVVLVPWPASFGKRAPRSFASGLSWPWPSIAMGALLLLGSGASGLRGETRGYPFACYPTFAGRFPPVAPDLLVELVAPDGSSVRLERDFRAPRSQQEWGRVYYLMGAYGSPPSDEQLRLFAELAPRSAGERAALKRAARLRFYVANYATAPDKWGAPPVALRLLRELSATAAPA